MKDDYTDITIILDRSGSMFTCRDDTIGGFNAFLHEQQKLPGKATLTLVQFDDQYEVVHNCLNIKEVLDLDSNTFVPRGMTALHDAIGRSINAAGTRFSVMSENDRPSKVIFVIITDGYENSSKEFSSAKIKEMIGHQSEKYKWEFVYIGANQDAITVGKDLGINPNASLSYAANTRGTKSAFASLNSGLKQFRSASIGATYSFSNSDRDAQNDAGA